MPKGAAATREDLGTAMRGIILYKSKYGTTERYATLLSYEMGFYLTKVSDADIDVVSTYDVIVLCGGIYASKIAGLSFLRRHIGELKGKRIMVFCCGASPYDESAFNDIVASNLKGELQGIPCFYGRGALDMKNLTFKDRMICKALRKALAKKDPSTYEPLEAALMSVDEDKAVDWTDIAYLDPLLAEIRKPSSQA